MLRLSPPVRVHRVSLKSDETTFIAGKRGSGKSYWGRFLLRAWHKAGNKERFWPIVIIDQDQGWLKHLHQEGIGLAERPEEATVERPWDITATGKLDPRARVMIFHPTLPAWDDPKFLGLMQEIFDTENIILYFDELFGVVDSHHTPLIVKKLWSSGRKKHIVIIALCQRPVGIDRIIVTQADNYLIFFLGDPDDRDVMAAACGDPQVKAPAPLYSHWEMGASDQYAQIVGPLPESEIR